MQLGRGVRGVIKFNSHRDPMQFKFPPRKVEVRKKLTQVRLSELPKSTDISA